MHDLREKFAQEGYVIARSQAAQKKVALLKKSFEHNFKSRFGADPETNRNLIKRFADSIEMASLFASDDLRQLVQAIGIDAPVYCGPVVSHYTHHDLTGNAYGLPWHQDFPSMASSTNSVIVWISVNDCNVQTHSVEVLPGMHRGGLLPGEQRDHGYVLNEQDFSESVVLKIQAGEVLIFSPYLPHRTYVNPQSESYKLSFSRRFDDLQCPTWGQRKFANAYGMSVDRSLYQRQQHSA